MKKLIIAAAVLAFATGVNAQDVAGGADAKEGTIGGVATTTVAAGVVGVAVAAAVISNNRGSSTSNPAATCDTPAEDVGGGQCVRVIVTGTGTNTFTATQAYAPSVK